MAESVDDRHRYSIFLG